ncbi:MAG: hypothetical protein M0C28_05740 [Candidatus Moduliflexus flocculans]|nr:hypothetical protein [Candidatus Moduliflexus flocculans]
MARELTKIHEEFLRGTVAELAAAIGTRDPQGRSDGPRRRRPDRLYLLAILNIISIFYE